MDIDPIAGEGAVIDRAMRHGEVAFGFDRNVVRLQNRITPLVHFIHGDDAVAVGIFEREIDPHLGRIG